MNKLQIITEPNKLLHEKSAKIKKVDETVRQLALDMVNIMNSNKGIGLSAVQVGHLKRLMVIGYEIDDETDLDQLELANNLPTTVFINPKITYFSKDTEILEEGCLSFPNLEIPVARSKKIHIMAEDLQGKKFKIKASGIFARVIQHEYDHLDGIVITDKISKSKLNKILKKKKDH